ncbi:ADP-ribosylation [Laetiporus sulphureus 93-53]|uniref:ADP-ribosylation n=1 Tax=Laetiporus sulphureus 93-53 TaxID=1314785 RepID=A0A165BRU4_9APHY|nr:ADP-ribosylation [Laetiporus sulphureus 93-53]KZT01538.1 ADP-ribosylation [Laetiporus sulphureus 93-53]
MANVNAILGMINFNVCEECRARPKYVESTGYTHPYCGKQCANTASSRKSLPTNATMCIVCKSRPQFTDGTRKHQFCSRTCASKHKPATPQRNTINKNAITNGLCLLPGCNKPAFKSANGTGKYCTNAHKNLGETACLWCFQRPKQGTFHYCSRACAAEAQKHAIVLLEIPEGHAVYKSVAEQFKSSWRHATPCPTVRYIYKIVESKTSQDKYEQYKAAVESRGNFVAAGRPAGNENRRWHGTRRECTLGDNSNAQLCSSATCSLCCIIKTSFDLKFFAKKTGWGRFGAGIYTSSTSSKSNDYSQNITASPYKAVLLNKVVVGKGHKLTMDKPSLTAPPAGFDSVLAEKGGILNHDELVVYTNDAVRPSYLVIYG